MRGGERPGNGGRGAGQLDHLRTLLEAGDEVIVVSPGYRQVWGLAKNAAVT